MAFQSLYRKYRPQRFEQLYGQEHVTAALRNAVRDDRVGHAYLFSGPRGTGKTTTARILAKALNCLNLGADGEPCDECENCRSISSGIFSDLVEMDAASNNGVEAIRDLIERVSLGLGATARRKVYLVDEVHMLTAAASNALLKTLEEPPAHVAFVLATTNPEKVLPTIRSRTQHYEFTLLSLDQLVANLEGVLASEGITADPEALSVIARRASGSSRDALSLLDQALAHADGSVTVAAVERALGGAPFEQRATVLDAVAAEDVAGTLVGLVGLLDAGHDARRIAEDLLSALRDAFLLVAGRGRVRIDATAEESARLQQVGEAMGNGGLVRAMETLGQAVVDMRGTDAADPRLVLEIALVRLARRDSGTPLQALSERVERLEAVPTGGVVVPATGGAPEPSDALALGEAKAKPALGAFKQQAPAAPAAEPAVPESPGSDAPVIPSPPPAVATTASADAALVLDLDDVILAWDKVLSGLPRAVRSGVQEAQPLTVDGSVITFGVSRRLIDTVKPRFQKEAQVIRAAFVEALGGPPKFKFTVHDFTGSGAATPARGKRGKSTTSAQESDPADPAEPPGPPEPDDEMVDLAEVVDAPSAAGSGLDSVTRLQDALGATVVEEQPHG